MDLSQICHRLPHQGVNCARGITQEKRRKSNSHRKQTNKMIVTSYTTNNTTFTDKENIFNESVDLFMLKYQI